jgi:hypothetical protein
VFVFRSRSATSIRLLAGKMNFLSLRRERTAPTFLMISQASALILCKARDKIVAEYALRDVSKPVEVSEYQLPAA